MRFGWRGVIGVIISAGALYLALRNVHFGEVVQHVRDANGWLLAASTITATAIFPLRARRWKPILDPVAPGLRFGQLWRPTAIGMMVSNLVPARAGEPARAFALTRETRQVPFTTAFASIAVDRVFDAALILILMALATLDPRFGSTARIGNQSVATMMLGALVFAAAVLAGLYTFVFRPQWITGLWTAVARRAAPKLEPRGRALLESFARGLAVLRSPSRFAAIFFWALLHWLVNALAFYLAFLALGIDVPFSAALFLQGVISIGVAAPSTPGFVGVFELAARLGLAVYAVPETLAATWALVFHTLSFIPITVIGGYYFLRMGIHLADVKAADAGQATPG